MVGNISPSAFQFHYEQSLFSLGIVAGGCALLAELLVQFFTWYKTAKTRRILRKLEPRMSVVDLLLRDGEFYIQTSLFTGVDTLILSRKFVISARNACDERKICILTPLHRLLTCLTVVSFSVVSEYHFKTFETLFRHYFQSSMNLTLSYYRMIHTPWPTNDSTLIHLTSLLPE